MAEAIDRNLLERAKGGDAKAFDDLVRPHRRAIEAHCYRMLGSLADAEDAVQETLLRAWKSLAGWEERSALRTWLHRIATNVAIDAATRRGPRTQTEREDPPWLEPAPPDLWEDTQPTPEAAISARESVHVAFICAIQRLPASQRAVLLLREVLGWSAQEVADLLEMTVPAVNSALQRGRATLEARPVKEPRDDETIRALVTRYVRAWNDTPEAFAGLLRDDAVLTMPPFPTWFTGSAAIVEFYGSLRTMLGELKWVPTMAAGVPAIASYERKPGAAEYAAHSIHVLRVDGDRIAEIHAFLVPGIFARFGLPASIP